MGLETANYKPKCWSSDGLVSFEAEAADRSAKSIVLVTLACGIVLLAWSIGDFYYFPEQAILFLCYRAAAVVSCGLFALVATRLQVPFARFCAMWLWFLPWAVQSAFMIPQTPAHVLSHVLVITIAQIGSAGFMIWTWKWGFTMSLALLGIGEWAISLIHVDGYDLFASHAYLMVGVALNLVFTRVKYLSVREQFDRRFLLEQERLRTQGLLDQIRELRGERLSWLENLARFLRHELKNQTIAMRTSLELFVQTEARVPREHYVERARRSLSRMNRLVETATDATSLAAALHCEQKTEVDLSALVDELVLSIRRAHADLPIQAEIEQGIRLTGNEDRMLQMLDKLFENAVEHTSAEGEVRVSLARRNGEARLAVENVGDPLPVDRDRIFDAFVSLNEGAFGANNLGLGLFVAKTIVEGHGGRIVAQSLAGADGARFEVHLPIG